MRALSSTPGQRTHRDRVEPIALSAVPEQSNAQPAGVALRYDVVGVGNALVDVISHADDHFIDRHDLV